MNRIILLILCLPLFLFVACGGDKPAEESSVENAVKQADSENSETTEGLKSDLQSKASDVTKAAEAQKEAIVNKAKDVAKTAEVQKEALMEKKDALVQKMQSALTGAGSMDNLKGTASNALGKLTGGGDGADTKALMEKVNSTKAEVTKHIAAIKEATPDNWESLKAKAEDALAKFNQAVAAAKSD